MKSINYYLLSMSKYPHGDFTLVLKCAQQLKKYGFNGENGQPRIYLADLENVEMVYGEKVTDYARKIVKDILWKKEKNLVN